MINFFACISWPLLIGGTFGAYRFGKKRWGSKGSILLPVVFLIVALLVLALWIPPRFWLELFFSPYLAQ